MSRHWRRCGKNSLVWAATGLGALVMCCVGGARGYSARVAEIDRVNPRLELRTALYVDAASCRNAPACIEFLRFTLRGLPAGAVVTLRCTSGCRLRERVVAPRSRLVRSRQFVHVRFPRGARIEVRATKKNFVGFFDEITVVARRIPLQGVTERRRCLPRTGPAIPGPCAQIIRADRVLADSTKDFSGRQGAKGWFYGYFRGPDNLAFRRMTFFGSPFGVPGWYVNPNSFWTVLTAYGAHPNVCGKDVRCRRPFASVQKAVRRWVSPVAGRVLITGAVAKADTSCGDGIVAHVLVRAKHFTDYKYAVDPADNRGKRIVLKVNVAVGSIIDFVVDPRTYRRARGSNSDSCDTTTFFVRISRG